ncbi:MAG TPA: aminotransferase class I/II-fold pyridoxal phosphate-dependent enzyme [Bryobacteraceae bacterium]|jgi:histidinol-phosphate/aromatic aminotransferase/cobyric acid decarboxylase-like protein|nr:aminotransferase class I/II-fold pyridoxal phosphate-dependent enzyme [Bryobacteraceae bacterium]
MALTPKLTASLLQRGFSRRHIARISMGAAAAIPFFNEFAMAQQAERQQQAGNGGGRRGGMGGGMRAFDPDVVRITSNENPMGPSKEGLEALLKVAPMGWRYSPQGENMEFNSLLATTENVPQDHVVAFPGSSIPLANSAAAFTSPTRSWVMAGPGYGSGAGRWIGAKTISVPLRPDRSHDVEAMIKADPNAGVFYICNPNNPTGTLTPRKDLEYILANKPKDSVLVIDEAYVHFSGMENSSMDFVRDGKDVVILRTFSKIYGMAGLRAGAAYGRPDLVGKVREFGGSGFMPVTATACAAASLKLGEGLIKERQGINKKNRDLAFEHLEKVGVGYIPSLTNFFMIEVKGMAGQQVNQAMAQHKVMIGRVWKEWPQMVRVTVGTTEEMGKFNAALDKVLQEGPAKSNG